MDDAFISYSRKDKEFVRQLHGAFKQQNREIWVDWEDIPTGAEWWREIEKGIEHANTFVFTLSPDSVQSSVCGQEIEHAIKYNKRIIPILYRVVPPTDVHPKLAALNWIYFTNPDDFAQSFQSLLSTIDTDLEYVKTHTWLLNRAIEWKDKQNDSSFLLRGKELREAEQWLSASAKVPKPTPLQTEFVVRSRQREVRKQNFLLIAVGIGLLLMVFLSVFAEWQRVGAVHNQIVALSNWSKASLLTRDDIGALGAGIKAMKEVQHLLWHPAKLEKSTRDILRLAVYNVKERNRLQGHTETIRAVQVSPDGQFILSTASDHTLKIWQADGTLLFDKPLNGSGLNVALSPVGRLLAVSTSTGLIEVWNMDCLRDYLARAQQSKQPVSGATAAECLLKTVQQTGGVKAIVLTPEGRWLITGGLQDAAIRVWNIEGDHSSPVQTVIEHQDSIEDLAISPDGQWLASASADNTVKVWRVSDGQLQGSQTLAAHEDRVYGVRFSPKKGLLVSVSADNTMIFWEMVGEQWVKQKSIEAHSNWINTIAFSQDGTLIATGSSDKTVNIWNSIGILLEQLYGHRGDILALSFTPDAKSIVSAGTDKIIHLHHLEGGRVRILQGHHSGLKDVVFSHDGQWLVSVSMDKTIKVWDAKNGTLQRSIDIPSGARKVEFSPGNQLVAVATYNKQVQLWDMQGKLVTNWPTGAYTAKSLAFSSDGQVIVTVDRAIRLWKLDGTLINTFGSGQEGHQGTINDVSVNPDGQLLASAGTDGTIKLWHPDGQLLKTLTGHQGWVNGVNFSADGNYLVSASSDKTVKVWTREGVLVRTLENNGHTAWVWDAEMSPTKPIVIASVSSDDTVKLWDLEGKMLSSLDEHKNWVRAVSFSPDGKKFATASADKTLILWDLSKELKESSLKSDSATTDLLLEQGCNWLHDYLKTNPNLTEDQREICD